MEYVYIKGKDTEKLFDRSETRLSDYQSPMLLKMLIYFTKIAINVATRMCNSKKHYKTINLKINIRRK